MWGESASDTVRQKVRNRNELESQNKKEKQIKCQLMKFTVDFHFGLVLSCFGHFCFSFFFYGLLQRLQEGFTGFSRAVGFVSFVFGNEANESTNKNDRYETVRTFYLNKGHRWH